MHDGKKVITIKLSGSIQSINVEKSCSFIEICILNQEMQKIYIPCVSFPTVFCLGLQSRKAVDACFDAAAGCAAANIINRFSISPEKDYVLCSKKHSGGGTQLSFVVWAICG